MIEECNFKRKIKEDIHSELLETETKVLIKKGVYCRLSGLLGSDCAGEENCILFQLYYKR